MSTPKRAEGEKTKTLGARAAELFCQKTEQKASAEENTPAPEIAGAVGWLSVGE
jgi:hypothetical protein